MAEQNNINTDQAAAVKGVGEAFGFTPTVGGAPAPVPTPTTGAGITGTAIDALIDESGGITSSSGSDLAKAMEEIQGNLKKSAEASASRIELGAESERGRITDERSGTRTDLLSRQRGTGFLTNLRLTEKFDKQTESLIKDVETQKEQALLANDVALYDKLTEIQLSTLDRQQVAHQNFVQNSLAVASLGQQQTQNEQNQQQIDFSQVDTTNKAIAKTQENIQNILTTSPAALNVMTKSGVSVSDFSSVDEAIAFVAPFLSAQEQRDIRQQNAQIEASNNQSKSAFEDNARLQASNSLNAAAVARGGSPTLGDFIETRGTSALDVDEFNERFGHMLSKDDQLLISLDLGF